MVDQGVVNTTRRQRPRQAKPLASWCSSPTHDLVRATPVLYAADVRTATAASVAPRLRQTCESPAYLLAAVQASNGKQWAKVNSVCLRAARRRAVHRRSATSAHRHFSSRRSISALSSGQGQSWWTEPTDLTIPSPDFLAQLKNKVFNTKKKHPPSFS